MITHKPGKPGKNVLQIDRRDGTPSNIGVAVGSDWGADEGSLLIRADDKPPGCNLDALASVIGKPAVDAYKKTGKISDI